MNSRLSAYNNIDEVIGTYSTEDVSCTRELFSCMPPPSLEGDVFSIQFVNFLEKVIDKLKSIDVNGLYDISDHVLSRDVFCEHFMTNIGSMLEVIQNHDPNSRCCDLHVAPDSLHNKYANLMWELQLVAYTLDETGNMVSQEPMIEMKRYSTSIYITWLGTQYAIISKFNPLSQELEEV